MLKPHKMTQSRATCNTVGITVKWSVTEPLLTRPVCSEGQMCWIIIISSSSRVPAPGSGAGFGSQPSPSLGVNSLSPPIGTRPCAHTLISMEMSCISDQANMQSHIACCSRATAGYCSKVSVSPCRCSRIKERRLTRERRCKLNVTVIQLCLQMEAV